MVVRRTSRSPAALKEQFAAIRGFLEMRTIALLTACSQRRANFRPDCTLYQSDWSKISDTAASLRVNRDLVTASHAHARREPNLFFESRRSRSRFLLPDVQPSIPVPDSPSGALCPAGSTRGHTRWAYPNHLRRLAPQHTPSRLPGERCLMMSLPYRHIMTFYEDTSCQRYVGS